MFKIPFGWLPGHWGLKGPVRDEARIYYEISDPKERELALINLKYRNLNDEKSIKNKELEILELKKKYNEISDFDYELRRAELVFESKEKIEEEKNEIMFKYKKISETEYERNLANIRKEPWIKIVSEFLFEINNSPKLGFKFEWNEYFIKYLESNGYKGFSEESIVEKWFNDVVKNNILTDMDDDVFEEHKRARNEFVRKINKNSDGKGRSEYS